MGFKLFDLDAAKKAIGQTPTAKPTPPPTPRPTSAATNARTLMSGTSPAPVPVVSSAIPVTAVASAISSAVTPATTIDPSFLAMVEETLNKDTGVNPGYQELLKQMKALKDAGMNDETMCLKYAISTTCAAHGWQPAQLISVVQERLTLVDRSQAEFEQGLEETAREDSQAKSAKVQELARSIAEAEGQIASVRQQLESQLSQLETRKNQFSTERDAVTQELTRVEADKMRLERGYAAACDVHRKALTALLNKLQTTS